MYSNNFTANSCVSQKVKIIEKDWCVCFYELVYKIDDKMYRVREYFDKLIIQNKVSHLVNRLRITMMTLDGELYWATRSKKTRRIQLKHPPLLLMSFSESPRQLLLPRYISSMSWWVMIYGMHSVICMFQVLCWKFVHGMLLCF